MLNAKSQPQPGGTRSTIRLWRPLALSSVFWCAACVPGASRAQSAPLAAAPSTAGGLTAVAGLRVGHFTLAERPTGCTVILAPQGAVAGVDVRGSAPGTRETDLLDPVNTVSVVHGILLTGGSAFGLDAAGGVMRYLEEQNIGFDMRVVRVPIVPAAVIYDLGIGDPKVRPGAECGYRASQGATSGAVAEGSIGAGAGATVGKLFGGARAMKGGVGTASITLPDGLTISAIVVVNAVGDVIDQATGAVVAGVRGEDGRSLADARRLIRSGATRPAARSGENTTIGVVATNATLTKAQAKKVAQMAHDGMARAISPAHTMGDGDTIFSLATGERAEPAEVTTIGALAADVMAEAIVRAVRAARGLPGYPSVQDLMPGR
ncbi:MAG: P1 family peptidase [Gemmatimonadaceae bacterium]|nr:P1 family peptidase [Gemmatimonadaceae bacterium]